MTHLIFGRADMKPEARRDKREKKRKKNCWSQTITPPCTRV